MVELQASSITNDTFLIGGNNELTNIEIIQKLTSILEPTKTWDLHESIQFVEDRKGHDLRYAIDDSKLR